MFAEIGARAAYTLAGIFGFLLVATIVTLSMRLRSPEGTHTELQKRINSWWVILGLFGASLVLPQWIAIIFFAFVSFLALKEYFTRTIARKADRQVLFWGYLMIPLQYLFVAYNNFEMFIVLIPVYGLFVLAARTVLTGQTDGFLRSVGATFFGVMMAVFGISHLAYLLVLGGEGGSVTGASMVLYVVILTQLNDVFQYIWGKKFGKRKIAPTVSPNKTWEGFLGGLGTTFVLGLVLGSWLTPLPFYLAAISGLLIATLGFMGDLIVSSIKRDLKIKDMGAMLPGHGGILDRVDSLMFTAPIMLHFIRFFCFLHGGN